MGFTMTSVPRIAIPEPHSSNPDYNARALPQYEHALRESGAEPVLVPLDATPDEVARIVAQCHGVLLPGSPADVDPQKFNAARHEKTAPPDPRRDMADELLLQDAYNLRKPIFGICYGLQSLNVWRSGTLLQHIESPVNHAAGREVLRAHPVKVEARSRLAALVSAAGERFPEIPTNSSHHQAAEVVGDALRAVAVCPEDGVIEAVEGTAPDHFVMAVQWHPERTFESEPVSRMLFREFVVAATGHPLR